MNESRRQFLKRISQAGGYSATYAAMRAMGIFESDAAVPVLPQDPSAGRGKSVVILGAGMAGLASAYQLEKLGFHCTVIEARSRVGGRVWTIRPGDRIEHVGLPDQVCALDTGLYLNAGAGRLPGDHRLVMHYCKELGVPLEVLVNDCRSALDQSDDEFNGKPVQLRQVTFDTRGRVAELLAKATKQHNLDQPLSASDREKLLSFLKQWGDLGDDYSYHGSERAGYVSQPGPGKNSGTIKPPLTLEALMDPLLYRGAEFAESFDMQATMFEPVGGMDHIPKSLAKKISSPILLGSGVTGIRNLSDGVEVTYRKGGATLSVKADFCICTIPLSVLRTIPANFSIAYREVIEKRPYENAVKIAFQSPRFWEEDAIYGGLSFTGRDTKMVWYPSTDYHSEQGVIVAAYSFGEPVTRLLKRGIDEQVQYARETINILHPGHGASLKNGLRIEWARIPHNLGSWSTMDDNPIGYDTLLEPDGSIYFAGDHVSHLVGWIEGAISSAHRVVSMIEDRTRHSAVALA